MKSIRKFCYFAICAALLLICFDSASKFILTGYERGVKNHDSKDFSKAFPVFIKLAKQGDKRAQYYVGRMNHLGEGIPQDKREAVRWYRMSAEQGFARAQNNLGILMLEQGNISEAVALFEKAIAQGLPQARKNLEAALQQEQLVIQRDLAARPNTPAQQNAHDPSMEFNFHRMRDSLR